MCYIYKLEMNKIKKESIQKTKKNHRIVQETGPRNDIEIEPTRTEKGNCRK